MPAASAGAAPAGAFSGNTPAAASSATPGADVGPASDVILRVGRKPGQLSTSAALKCTKGRVCTWTKYNFKGDPGRSKAERGVCYHGSAFRSMKNRTSKRLRVYFDMNCRGSYQVVRPGTSVKKFRRGGNRWSCKPY
ncbi:peptidase inhibitor family I36 protein [Spirillospora sp. CA-128828]|uniref:peptidase inhibitor family I36 protein n=1 Tax=Spirillospora sp. CA-128828 TaxID=3240033 RepID=UPI003D8F0F7A